VKRQPPFLPNFAGPVDGIYNSDPDAPYVNGNPATGEEGSIPPYEAVDHPQTELHHLIQYSGQTPSHEDLEQVRKAIKKMIEDGTDSTPLSEGAVAIWGGLRAVDGIHKIRSLKPGANITIEAVETGPDSGEFEIVISSTAAGGGGGGEEGLPLVNVGDGQQIYKGTNIVDGQEEFRTVKGVNGVNVTTDGNVVKVDGAGFGQLFPFFPEVETADGKLTITASVGQVIVANGQSFIHRGARRILTSDTLIAARTLPTVESKSYHLRARWSSGAIVYELKDLADGTYNPGALAESHATFDTTYDDMLIARVTTNASNVPTVTPLVNKDRLFGRFSASFVSGSPHNGWTPAWNMTFNWARTPTALERMRYLQFEEGYSGTKDWDNGTAISTMTRYGATGVAIHDMARASTTFYVDLLAMA